MLFSLEWYIVVHSGISLILLVQILIGVIYARMVHSSISLILMVQILIGVKPRMMHSGTFFVYLDFTGTNSDWC